jgi:tetratricopeptide (TPR) repeat protein
MNSDARRLLDDASRLTALGRRAEAIALYQRLLALEPDRPDSWYNLGMLLRADGQAEAALAAYQEALDRGIAGPEEARLNRAVILSDDLRRNNEAETELIEALETNPDYVPAMLNLANLKEECGEREIAAGLYRRILPPDDGSPAPYLDLRLEALARLAHLEPPASADDPALRQLEAAAAQRGTIGAETRANLYYSLGRALDRLGEYDRAFAAYAEANRNVRRAGPPYDRSRIVREVAALIAEFPSPAPHRRSAGAPRPVFICGMFRSGSTLAEQVLAAHPMATPGGELNLLNRIEVDLAPYPQSICTLSDERAASIAEAYRRELVRLFPQSAAQGAIVTDKRPDNFLRIGLIKRLFPDAKIIHTVRNPVDTCLSVYFEHIDQRLVGYASDLIDCAHYYGQYRRMTAHWKSLYPDDILDFDYDRFVAEPRPALERLLEFLGLGWDEKCLSFHELRNPVKTASYWQVRRPLYTASSGRRRHYEAHLAPLVAALREAGVETN